MKYNQISPLKDEQFRRLTGVKRPTFKRMLEILTEADRKKKARGDRKNKLILADQLLLTLRYIRGYRAYFIFHGSYGTSESSVYKTVRWVEDILIKHPYLALPGRKTLLKSEVDL